MNDFHNLENLDTSFVKLEALVRYLCRRGFVGAIRMKFDGYRAVITVTPAGKLRVSEFNDLGRPVRSGQTAFQSVILKAQTPGGIIEVIGGEGGDDHRFGINHEAVTDTVIRPSESEPQSTSKLICHVRIDPSKAKIVQRARGSLSELADFPFDLTNHFEDEAASPTDRELRLEMMIDVTSDLLSSIDEVLGQAGLDFALALQKACSDVAHNYSFLDPEKQLFRYSHGFVYISPDVRLRSLATGIGEALIRVFDRLGSNTKFSDVYSHVCEKIELLARTRKDEFDRTGMGRQVDRLLKPS